MYRKLSGIHYPRQIVLFLFIWDPDGASVNVVTCTPEENLVKTL